MTLQGRQWLYRINIRCAEQWGAAMARQSEPESARNLAERSFESNAWYAAITILNSLRFGFPIDTKFAKENGKNGKSSQ